MRNFAGRDLQNPGFMPHCPSVVLQSYSVQPKGGLGNPQEVLIAVFIIMYDGSSGIRVKYGAKPSASTPKRNCPSTYQCT